MAFKAKTDIARACGALIGAGLAAALIASSGPAAGGQALGAEVSFYSNPTGELAVAPAGPDNFLHEPSLLPGGPAATGDFELTNQTAVPMALRARAAASAHVLDDELLVEVRRGDSVLATGTLAELAAPSETSLVIESGSTERIAVSASLADTADGAAAALVDVALTFDATPVRSGK